MLYQGFFFHIVGWYRNPSLCGRISVCCCWCGHCKKRRGELLYSNYFRNAFTVSNSLDPDQDRHSVGPDLVPNCFQRLLVEDKVIPSKERVKYSKNLELSHFQLDMSCFQPEMSSFLLTSLNFYSGHVTMLKSHIGESILLIIAIKY